MLNFVNYSLVVGTFKSYDFLSPTDFVFTLPISANYLATKNHLVLIELVQGSGMKLGKYLCRNQGNFKPAGMYV
jgi:hypothetical protein